MHISSDSLRACLGRFRNLTVEFELGSTVVERIYKEQIGDAVHKQIPPENDWNSARRNEFKRPAFEGLGTGIFCETKGSLESMCSEKIPWGLDSDWEREIPLLELLVSKSLGTFSITHGENSIVSPASYLRVNIDYRATTIDRGGSNFGPMQPYISR